MAVVPFVAAAALAASISVEDLVRFSVIGDPNTLEEQELSSERMRSAGVFSPDGRQVAVVTRAGNLETKTNDGVLRIYRVADLFSTPAPQLEFKFSSATNYQPLALVRWLADSKTLVFAATEAREPSQVYSVNTDSGGLIQLTHQNGRLAEYAIDSNGRRLVTFAEELSTPPDKDPSCVAEGCRVTVDRYNDLETGRAEGALSATVYDFSSGRMTKVASRPDKNVENVRVCNIAQFSSLSPDGRFLYQLCRVRETPQWWGDYVTASGIRTCVQRNNTECFLRGIVTDVETNTAFATSASPQVVFDLEPIWIDSGRSLVISNALEPLDSVTGGERAARTAAYSVLQFDPYTRTSKRIVRLAAGTVAVDGKWGEPDKTLLLVTKELKTGTLSKLKLKRLGQNWLKAPFAEDVFKDKGSAIELEITQSLNDPPLLYAKDRVSGRRQRILDPNPWLKDRRLGRVQSISWQSKDGRAWRGALYYPVAYSAGSRYPLLIQTHGFEPEKFSLQGVARNFPGQALAAYGIAVLQMAETIGDAIATPAEWAAVQNGYESAIDYLDGTGVIDRQRVGVQGWSRTGPHMGYVFTHSSYPFAAGAFTGTADFGWLWYLFSGAPVSVDGLYGSAPFGAGLNSWNKYSPTFNLQRVNTPMLLWGNGSGWVLWDWYAGLRKLGKPVEYWISPEGTHDVFRVEQRLTSNRLVVDWFRFWLKGEEDPDPDKAGQYERWRQLQKIPI